MANREDISQYYLKKHRLAELFENMTSALVFERPDDPKSFMAEYLRKLKQARDAKSNSPCLFNETNVRSLFGMLDPAGRGYINHSQYKAGMDNLGVTTYERNPPGSDNDQISLQTFMAEAREGLTVSSATFIERIE